jgi:CheY-like chemotaxis protein
VLVVEDNPVNQRLTVRLLEKLGCRTDVAANGRAAVERLAGLSYDLVFMDCQMPELDGYEATRLIRASATPAARVPIVAMTANAMRGDRERCLAAGMDDYLSKPIKPSDLSRMLERWCPIDRSESGADAAQPASGPIERRALEQLRAYDPSGSLLTELCRLFLQQTPPRLADLAAAAEQGDFARLGFVAHTVKGACWILGARQMGELAADLEQQATAGAVRGAGEQVSRLVREFEVVRPAYERELKTAAAEAG